MRLPSLIESILFFRGEPVSIRDLAKTLDMKPGDVTAALEELKTSLAGHGITLVMNDDEAMLATAPNAHELIARIRKEELEKDPGKAGLETLALVLYEGPITRAQIDYVRGVNSTFTLRQLMIRGLIERVDNPEDQRSFLYKPSLELLSFLGVSSRDELPDFAGVREAFDTFRKGADDNAAQEEHGSEQPTTENK